MSTARAEDILKRHRLPENIGGQDGPFSKILNGIAELRVAESIPACLPPKSVPT